ncbi:MAG TPA: hypothetical protein VIV55_02100 [Flavobacterium sp.]
MTEVFSHLTENQLDELIGRYKAKEKPSILISEYKLNLLPKQLYWHLPAEVLEENCNFCHANLIRNIRSQHAQAFIRTPAYCPNCRHTEDESCSCKNCRTSRWDDDETEDVSKQEFVDNIINQAAKIKINLEDLNLTDKLYLGILLREGVSEDFTYINPIENFYNPLALSNEFINEIIIRLKAINAIFFHPSNASEFIEITDYNNGNYTYNPYKMKWLLNVKSEELDNVAFIESTLNPKDLNDSQFHEALQLWKKIALYESIEYFKYNVKSYFGIDYEIGAKTKTILKELTNDYSVAQIYGIINKSIIKALKFRAENETSRKRASKTIIGYIQSSGEKAKKKNKVLKKASRIKACPESALSKFFFERIIKIGYEGFSEVPSISKLQNKQPIATVDGSIK